jgi:uncharacterized membrane protein
MDQKRLFVAVAEYDSLDAAEEDYNAVKQLHKDKMIGSYDAAVVTKTPDGKVKMSKRDELPTQHWGFGGALVGGVIGAVFAPAVIPAAIVGAGAGAVAGHFKDGLPKNDLKELGETLEAGDAALVVIGENTVDKAFTNALQHEVKLRKKEMDADFDKISDAIKEAQRSN